MKAFLVLDNGTVWEGESFGYETQSVGEVVFNTSMTGYQEILTDPSYCKQIITMTYPMIGSYGINEEDMESGYIQASGFIVKEYVPNPSNFRSTSSLSDFLKKYKIPAIQGIDTRKLTRFIRTNGSPNGGIFVADRYSDEFLQKVKKFPGLKGMGLVDEVSTKQKYTFGSQDSIRPKLAVYDFGVKLNILRLLDKTGFAVTVFPARTKAQEILSLGFDAFFLSNGPGDPEPLDFAIDSTKKIIESRKPLFGICLGHQIIGLAMGNRTDKLKFGHRGGNQPVKNFKTGQIEITSQNHGFAVLENSDNKIELTHINLNDNTIEGLVAKGLPVMAVQYHPESSPGPHDSEYLFNDFYKMVTNS